MARFIKGHNHGKLGLHRKGHNLYVRHGVQYKRVRGGFRALGGGRHHAAPYDPLKPLAGKDFTRELSSGVRLQFAPQEQQLASENRISGAQQHNITDWYGQYLNNLSSAQKSSAAGYKQAQQGVYNQANTAANQDEANRQKLNQEQQASAAQRGTAASPSPDSQQAAQANRSLSSAFGGLIGSLGASQNAYMGQQRVAGSQAAVGAHQDESRHQRQLSDLGRQLAQQKGDYASKLKADMRDSERKYALERQTFGLNVAQANEQASFHQGELRNVRHGQNLVARGKKLDRKLRARLHHIDAALRQQGLSETHRHNLNTERAAILRINKPRGGGGGGASGRLERSMSNQQLWSVIVSSARFDRKPNSWARKHPFLASAAREYLQSHGVSGRTRRRLRRYGIHVHLRRGPKRGV